MSETTSIALLGRLRGHTPAGQDWSRFRTIYEPLIKAWADRISGPAADADDICQEVFLVLLKKLSTFDRQREGSFRAWLRQITVWAARDVSRKSQRAGQVVGPDRDHLLMQLEDPNASLAQAWDAEHDRHVLGRLLRMVRGDFKPATWTAFWQTTMLARPVAEVADKLGLDPTAVMNAKARVLRRLREEVEGLIDDVDSIQ